MKTQAICNYSESLFELALEQNIIDAVKEDFVFISEVISKSNLLIATCLNPKITKEEKKEIIRKLFYENINKTTLNFLMILIDYNCFSLLKAIINEFNKQFYQYKNIQIVYVESAYTLSDNQKDNLVRALKEKLNKEIILECSVHHELLVGLKIKINDVVYDNSALQRLFTLKKAEIKI